MAAKTKVSAERWIETAREALIREGLGGLKVERLAKRLKVTRGGFYHHFADQQELLQRLLQDWIKTNEFVPEVPGNLSPPQAVQAIEQIADRIIDEREFSPPFELAVREWARVDAKVRKVVERVDAERLQRLGRLFEAFGCDAEEASVRARVLYFHQIGFYSLGYHERESHAERHKRLSLYLRILCGQRYIDAAFGEARRWA